MGVFELSGAFNDIKYLGKVGDEHLWVKIWNNNRIHMQIILSFSIKSTSNYLKYTEKCHEK